MSAINFEEFGAVNIPEARRLARDPEIKPLWLRVYFAALGWSNLIGHAEFAGGGLAIVLQSNDPTKGGMSVPGRSQVDAAIRVAKERTLIEDDSSADCLRPNIDLWQKAGGRGSRTCKHHKIRARGR